MAFPGVQSISAGSRLSNGGPFGSGTVIRVSMPTGVQVGDLLIAFGIGNSASIVPQTSGWNTLLAGAVFWKLADSNDLASTEDFAALVGTDNTESAEVTILRITGHDPSNPINAQHITQSSSSTTSPTDVGITPTLQCLLLMLMAGTNNTGSASANGYAIANSNPSWTEQGDNDSAGAAGTKHCQASVASANQTGAPNTATGTVSATFSRTELSWVFGIIAIQPPITVSAPTAALVSTFITPTFMKIIVAPIMALTSTLIAPAASAIGHAWRTTAKNVTSWLDQPKS